MVTQTKCSEFRRERGYSVNPLQKRRRLPESYLNRLRREAAIATAKTISHKMGTPIGAVVFGMGLMRSDLSKLKDLPDREGIMGRIDKIENSNLCEKLRILKSINDKTGAMPFEVKKVILKGPKHAQALGMRDVIDLVKPETEEIIQHMRTLYDDVKDIESQKIRAMLVTVDRSTKDVDDLLNALRNKKRFSVEIERNYGRMLKI